MWLVEGPKELAGLAHAEIRWRLETCVLIIAKPAEQAIRLAHIKREEQISHLHDEHVDVASRLFGERIGARIPFRRCESGQNLTEYGVHASHARSYFRLPQSADHENMVDSYIFKR
jgi:hypothetical protein